MLKNFLFGFIFFCLTVNSSFAQNREIAITIDDLPFVGESKGFHLDLIIKAITSSEIPATGFVIAREVGANTWPYLRKFREAGLGIGNHTLTHANLNQLSTKDYIHEISAADKILAPVLTKPKYFRYPYLAMSEGDKKKKVLNYLHENDYQVAPITVDSRDFVFNQLLLNVPEKNRREFLKTLKSSYLNFIWQQTLKAEEINRLNNNSERAQILLIHANLLNAYVLPELIDLYKKNGYTFISLKKALKTFQNTSKQSKNQKSKTDSEIETYLAWD